MVLDTSVCVDLLREGGRGERGAAHTAVEGLADTPVYISFFSLCELETGVLLSERNDEKWRLNALTLQLTVVRPDDAFPVLYAEAAAHLLRSGTPIPVMDLLIGISAKARSLPVLTHDVTHFSRIPGLQVHGY